MKTKIVKIKKIKPVKNGVLIIGLPGVGLIAKTAVSYIIHKLKCSLIAEIFSPYFPSQVIMKRDGGLEAFKCQLYYKKVKNKHLFLLTGDVQPTSHYGQYEFTEEFLNYTKSLGVSDLISLGGYGVGKYEQKKEIHGFSINAKSKLRKMKGVSVGKIDGVIAGLAGLLPTFAPMYGMKSICLLGETHGHYIDVECSKRILEVLNDYLKIDLDLKEIKKQAEEGEKIIKKIEEEIKNKIQQHHQESQFSYIR